MSQSQGSSSACKLRLSVVADLAHPFMTTTLPSSDVSLVEHRWNGSKQKFACWMLTTESAAAGRGRPFNRKLSLLCGFQRVRVCLHITVCIELQNLLNQCVIWARSSVPMRAMKQRQVCLNPFLLHGPNCVRMSVCVCVFKVCIRDHKLIWRPSLATSARVHSNICPDPLNKSASLCMCASSWTPVSSGCPRPLITEAELCLSCTHSVLDSYITPLLLTHYLTSLSPVSFIWVTPPFCPSSLHCLLS